MKIFVVIITREGAIGIQLVETVDVVIQPIETVYHNKNFYRSKMLTEPG